MTTPELIQLADLVRTYQTEFQTIEVKAAHGAPRLLPPVQRRRLRDAEHHPRR